MSSLHHREKIRTNSEAVSSHNKVVRDAVEHESTSRSGWKPYTFSTTYLSGLLLATLTFILVLALLEWYSTRYGGVFFAPDANSFGTGQIFLFRYLPNIITVMYGLAWGWIDLDTKRLEPWYQLSSRDGASGSGSMLLQYNADFFAFVPLKAAKLRHWIVCCVSLITLCVAFGIAPLQNGVFVFRILNVESEPTLHATNGLIPLPNQTSAISNNFLFDTYSILWLQQKLPPFTTLDYALAPLSLPSVPRGSNQTMLASTLMYSTNLTCKSPAFAGLDPSDSSGQFLSIDDGNGCYMNDIMISKDTVDPDEDEAFTTYYFGYYPVPGMMSSPKQAGCTDSAKHQFLAVWKHTSAFPPNFSDPSNATALICTPSYFKQPGLANISLPENSVNNFEPTGPAQPLTDAEFDIDRFEYILSVGNPPTDENAHDVINIQQVDGSSQYSAMNISSGRVQMNGVIFALGTTKRPAKEYLQPSVLSDAYQRAHRAMFAMAVRNVIATPGPDEHTTGRLSSEMSVVTVATAFTIPMQILLSMVAVVTCWLLRSLNRRKCSLNHDPDSLAQVMLLSREQNTRLEVAQDVLLPKKSEGADIQQSFYQLVNGPSRPIITSTSSRADPPAEELKSLEKDMTSCTASYAPVQPLEYRWWVSFGLAFLIAILLSTLAVLYQQNVLENGLPVPAVNDFILQLLTNVLPVLAATAAEPLWVLISRRACIMIPFERLSREASSARHSLMLRYTSLPPQLVAPQALKNKHYILFLLSLIALTANILTVAISGLFSVRELAQYDKTMINSIYLPQLTADVDLRSTVGRRTAFSIAMANLTYNTSLPDWTTKSHFFMPRDLNHSQSLLNEQTMSYSVNGLGGQLTCDDLSSTVGTSKSVGIALNTNATGMAILAYLEAPNGTAITCKTVSALTRSGTFSDANQTVPSMFSTIYGDARLINASKGIWDDVAYDARAVKTVQVFNQLLGIDAFDPEDDDPCGQFYIVGAIRAVNTFESPDDVNEFGVLSGTNISATLLVCQSSIIATPFNVTVSPSGSILSSVPTGSSFTNIQSSVNITRIMADVNRNLLTYNNLGWANTTYNTWPGYLASKLTESPFQIDPKLPLPTADQIKASMSDLYARIFAIHGSLYTPYFDKDNSSTPSNTAIPATISTPVRRIVMDPTSFKICVSLLSLDLLVAVIFFLTRPAPFLSKLPTNIAHQIELFSHSRVVDDVVQAIDQQGETLETLDRKGWKYMYGSILDSNGKVHVGIERVPFVTALPLRNVPNEQTTKTSTLAFLRRRRKCNYNDEDGDDNLDDEKYNNIDKQIPKSKQSRIATHEEVLDMTSSHDDSKSNHNHGHKPPYVTTIQNRESDMKRTMNGEITSTVTGKGRDGWI